MVSLSAHLGAAAVKMALGDWRGFIRLVLHQILKSIFEGDFSYLYVGVERLRSESIFFPHVSRRIFHSHFPSINA